MRRLICIALAAAMLGVPALAQETTTSAAPAPAADAAAAAAGAAAAAAGAAGAPEQKPAVIEPQPLPYSPDEFTPWLRDLRRGEIVAIGAFPVVYVFTQLGYNLFRFGAHGWDSEYAPLGNPNRAAYSEGETLGVLLGAASVSILIATADYLIGRRRRAAGGDP